MNFRRRFPICLALPFVLFFLPVDSCLASVPGNSRAHVLNVGYGDAIFMELPDGSTMMVNAGEQAFVPRIVSDLRSLRVGTSVYALGLQDE